jgi:hypothetical protein
MIKKIVFGLVWFVVIFLVSYIVGGIIYVNVNEIDTSGGIKTAIETGRAFRAAYLNYFLIGSLILAIIGTIAGILPGTKKKPRVKEKTTTKKKSDKKSRR